jgi:hypothetical protein
VIEARAITGAVRFDHKASAPIVIEPLNSIGHRGSPIQQMRQKHISSVLLVMWNLLPSYHVQGTVSQIVMSHLSRSKCKTTVQACTVVLHFDLPEIPKSYKDEG